MPQSGWNYFSLAIMCNILPDAMKTAHFPATFTFYLKTHFTLLSEDKGVFFFKDQTTEVGPAE